MIAVLVDLNIGFELLRFDEPRPFQLFAECARDLNNNGVLEGVLVETVSWRFLPLVRGCGGYSVVQPSRDR